MRNTIYLARKSSRSPKRSFTTRFHRWFDSLLNSNLFYFFWKSLTDARHRRILPDIAMFPVDLDKVLQARSVISPPLVNDLMDELQRNY